MPRPKSFKSNVKGVSYRKDTNKWVYRTRGLNHIYKEFASKTDAETFAYQLNANNNLGIKISANKELLLSDGIEIYIKQVPETNQCKEHTIRDYRANARNHIEPFFRGRTVISISKNDIEEFKRTLAKKPKQNKKGFLSARTINEILRLLNAVFEHLVDGGFIVDNPMLRVKFLPKKSKKREVLSLPEVHNLLKVAKEEYTVSSGGVKQGEYYILLLFSLVTGARKGETIALTWDDINLKEKIVRINKSFSHGILGTPKTTNSTRYIKIPVFLVEKLIKFKSEQSTNPLNLVFPNRVGKYYNGGNLTRRVLQRLIKKAGINKHIVWHSLRHTNATILAEQKVSPNVLQSQAGHVDITTTLGTYTHTTNKMYEYLMEKLEVFNIATNGKSELVERTDDNV